MSKPPVSAREALELLERSGHDLECKSLKRDQECDCHKSGFEALRAAVEEGEKQARVLQTMDGVIGTLRSERDELLESLRRVRDMSAPQYPNIEACNKCQCGRPTGIGAVYECARAALSLPDTQPEEARDAE